jgi:hypothetical protein
MDTLVVDVPWVIDVVRAFGVAVVIITVWLASPGPGIDGARGPAIAVALGLSAAAWVCWLLTGSRRVLNLGSLVVMGVAGGVLPLRCPTSCPRWSPSTARSAT